MYPCPTADPTPLDAYIVVLKGHVDDGAADAHIESVIAHHSDTISASSGPALSGLEHRCSIEGFKCYSGCFHDETLEHIKNSPEVDFVERDQVMEAKTFISQKNVPSYGIARISQRTQPDLTTYYYDDTAASGVTAYVIDTGINIAHKEFENRAKWGFNSADSINDDTAGHGTHVSGTIGGVTFGVAKKVSLIAVKVLGSNGKGTSTGVIRGIEWATADAKSKGISGKSVANMSLGGDYSPAMNMAVEAAIASGLTFMVAAGNEHKDAAEKSPASAPNAITVGATAKDDSMAIYSNYGPFVDIFAPGSQITSAWIGSTTAVRTLQGTSMATPHVSGLGACLIAAEKISGPQKVTARIKQLATKGAVTKITPVIPVTINALAYNGSGY